MNGYDDDSESRLAPVFIGSKNAAAWMVIRGRRQIEIKNNKETAIRSFSETANSRPFILPLRLKKKFGAKKL